MMMMKGRIEGQGPQVDYDYNDYQPPEFTPYNPSAPYPKISDFVSGGEFEPCCSRTSPRFRLPPCSETHFSQFLIIHTRSTTLRAVRSHWHRNQKALLPIIIRMLSLSMLASPSLILIFTSGEGGVYRAHWDCCFLVSFSNPSINWCFRTGNHLYLLYICVFLILTDDPIASFMCIWIVCIFLCLYFLRPRYLDRRTHGLLPSCGLNATSHLHSALLGWWGGLCVSSIISPS